MQAVRVHPAPPNSTPYSPSNPAPSTALVLDSGVPMPVLSKPGEILIRVKASTVIRDMLTWPETYPHEYAILGNDFAGIVTEVFSPDSKFKPGDEVFGMADADRAGMWAEYAIVMEDEVARKPAKFTFEEAAAVPLSAQTAYEALFEHAQIPCPTVKEFVSRSASHKDRRVLITGAAGAVGMYLVQLAAAAGVWVVAASSSNARNEDFLRRLGADEVVEYSALGSLQYRFDDIIDAVGGEVLAKLWNYVADNGTLISIDSASFNFVEEHEKRGLRKPGVRALFFVIKGSKQALGYLADLADAGAITSAVARTFPLSQAREAYDLANGRSFGHGKVVLAV